MLVCSYKRVTECAPNSALDVPTKVSLKDGSVQMLTSVSIYIYSSCTCTYYIHIYSHEFMCGCVGLFL
jgi:hypothetical protein